MRSSKSCPLDAAAIALRCTVEALEAATGTSSYHERQLAAAVESSSSTGLTGATFLFVLASTRLDRTVSFALHSRTSLADYYGALSECARYV